MIRRLALIVLAAAGVALGVAPSAPAVVIRSSCSAPGSKTVLRTRLIRVYYTRAKRPIGCLKRSGRRVPLDHWVDPFYAPGDAHLGRLRVAGDVLAYTWIDPGLPAVYVHSVSLRNGRALHRTKVEPYTIPDPTVIAVTALVVRSTGGMAWIQRVEGEISVWRFDRRGRRRVGIGPRISLRSLRLAGGRISWRDGGRRRTASLGR
jgi:hypothetical protein